MGRRMPWPHALGRGSLQRGRWPRIDRSSASPAAREGRTVFHGPAERGERVGPHHPSRPPARGALGRDRSPMAERFVQGARRGHGRGDGRAPRGAVVEGDDLRPLGAPGHLACPQAGPGTRLRADNGRGSPPGLHGARPPPGRGTCRRFNRPVPPWPRARRHGFLDPEARRVGPQERHRGERVMRLGLAGRWIHHDARQQDRLSDEPARPAVQHRLGRR